MALYIHREAKFNKYLNELRKSGGKASLVAKRAEEIIDRLASEERMPADEVNRWTKHGEHRINKCRKYDLGGYRLVCLKQGSDLVVLYVGAHDDCDRWLNNNSGLKLSTIPGNPKNHSVQKNEPGVECNGKEPDLEPDYDEILLEKIDEKTLRIVFHGLCRNRYYDRNRHPGK